MTNDEEVFLNDMRAPTTTITFTIPISIRRLMEETWAAGIAEPTPFDIHQYVGGILWSAFDALGPAGAQVSDAFMALNWQHGDVIVPILTGRSWPDREP